MEISTVRCLRDNFAYLVHARGATAVVDPGEAAPVRAALGARKLDAVWATHHHPDHVGGVRALAEAFPGLTVVVHRVDAPRVRAALGDAPAALVEIDDGAEVALGDVVARAIHNPGHTLGAVSFYLEPPGQAPAVFTGDTLFGAGCGRLFEGDAAMMHRSLMRLGALPGDARVYFGHEYTRANLRFAAAVSPGDPAVAARAAATEDHLGGGGDSAPSTMALERATNPFLRCAEPALARAAAARGAASADPAAVFAALRSWKDAF